MLRVQVGLTLLLAIAAEDSSSVISGTDVPTHTQADLGNDVRVPSVFLSQQPRGRSDDAVQRTESVPTSTTLAPEVVKLQAEVHRLNQLLASETLRRKTAEASVKRSQQNSSALARSAQEQEASSEAKIAKEKGALVEAQKDQRDADAATKAAQRNYIDEEEFGWMGPLGYWLESLPHQNWIAGCAATIGCLSVIGPNVFLKWMHALVGSIFAGLFFGSGVLVLMYHGSVPWVHAMSGMVHFRGDLSLIGYLFWFAWTWLGLVRYYTNCGCQCCAVVGEVRVDKDGNFVGADTTSAATPLLGTSARDVSGKPPRPPSLDMSKAAPQGHTTPSPRPSHRESSPRPSHGSRNPPPLEAVQAKAAASDTSNHSNGSRSTPRGQLPKARPSGTSSKMLNTVSSIGKQLSDKVNKTVSGHSGEGSRHADARPPR